MENALEDFGLRIAACIMFLITLPIGLTVIWYSNAVSAQTRAAFTERPAMVAGCDNRGEDLITVLETQLPQDKLNAIQTAFLGTRSVVDAERRRMYQAVRTQLRAQGLASSDPVVTALDAQIETLPESIPETPR